MPSPHHAAITPAPVSPAPTVILAEENDGLRRSIAGRIRLLGYGLSEAGNGSQLITALIQACFGPRAPAAGSLVVADLAPSRLVLDALRMLKSSPGCPSLVIALPRRALDVRAEARQLGAVAILDRPLDVEVLMKTIVAHLPLPRRVTAKDREQGRAWAL